MGKRGFEKVSLKVFDSKLKEKIPNTKEVYESMMMPERATSHSAGYDIFSVLNFSLAPGKSIVVPTGLKAYMQKDEYLAIHVRSSAGFKYGIALKNQVGIVDADYYNNSDNEGHILIAFTNFSDREWIIKKDDAIAQAIFNQYFIADGDSLNTEKKRNGGIGSTFKK
jgi:dUTP pyrophosphatase